jgi:hypothetical protein
MSVVVCVLDWHTHAHWYALTRTDVHSKALRLRKIVRLTLFSLLPTGTFTSAATNWCVCRWRSRRAKLLPPTMDLRPYVSLSPARLVSSQPFVVPVALLYTIRTDQSIHVSLAKYEHDMCRRMQAQVKRVKDALSLSDSYRYIRLQISYKSA